MLALAFLVASISAANPDEAVCSKVPVFARGAIVAEICAEAPHPGLTIVDLSDDWAPAIFSETPEQPQPYRQTFVDLANERLGEGRAWEAARRDRYFELFGIFPSVSVVSARLLDEPRHACHAVVDDTALRQLRRTLAPWTPSKESEKSALAAALVAVGQHLACEGLGKGLGKGLERTAPVHPTFDAALQDALGSYQRRHMLPSPGTLDVETRDSLLTDSRELDFRTLLRVLRERVVDATGLIEDGSAANAWEPILGRFIDSSEYRRSMRPRPLERGAPDLVDRATEAAAMALGWTSPPLAAQAMQSGPPDRVAIRLPRLPAYHAAPASLRAEVDRGDVWTSYPLDGDGHPLPSPVKNRPTFTLYVRSSDGEIPLVRWPTTIGAWKAEKLDGEHEALRYKASPVGRRYWRDLVAAPAWFPPPTTPDRELVRRRADGSWTADEVGVGPGYRSAYGLVALIHNRAVATAGGNTEFVDIEIRTHGSGNYRSILRGSSHGCHRLFNHLALRLGSFVLAHAGFARRGVIDERYGRTIAWKGRILKLRAESRGYRYELVPPIPVDVLPGRTVRSKEPPMFRDRAAPSAPGAQPGPPSVPQT